MRPEGPAQKDSATCSHFIVIHISFSFSQPDVSSLIFSIIISSAICLPSPSLCGSSVFFLNRFVSLPCTLLSHIFGFLSSSFFIFSLFFFRTGYFSSLFFHLKKKVIIKNSQTMPNRFFYVLMLSGTFGSSVIRCIFNEEKTWNDWCFEKKRTKISMGSSWGEEMLKPRIYRKAKREDQSLELGGLSIQIYSHLKRHKIQAVNMSMCI